MKLLCAITGCHWREEHLDWQRKTWIKQTPGIDIRVFLGKDENCQHILKDDEVLLDCADNYKGLPEKVQKVFQWALLQGYDYTFKTDDDMFVVPERLVESVPLGYDYVGRYWEPSHGYPYGFVSGGAYWVSRHVMSIIAEASLNNEEAEDRWVAGVLGEHRIVGKHDDRYKFVIRRTDPRTSKMNPMEFPRVGNKVAAVGEFQKSDLLTPFNLWNNSYQKFEKYEGRVKVT